MPVNLILSISLDEEPSIEREVQPQPELEQENQQEEENEPENRMGDVDLGDFRAPTDQPARVGAPGNWA